MWMRWGRTVLRLEQEMVRYGSAFGEHVQNSTESGHPGNQGMADALARVIKQHREETADMFRALENYQAAQRELVATYERITGKPAPPAARVAAHLARKYGGAA